MQDKLFKHYPTATLLHVETPRPLRTRLERYVLQDLSMDLQACDAGVMTLPELAARQQKLLKDERPRLLAITDREKAHEVQLDLTMLLGGYLLDRTEAFRLAPHLLLELLAANAKRYGFASRMTYELVVDVNTTAFVRTGGHIRVFCTGDVASIERDFYIGHYFAEQHIRSAYETLAAILCEPEQSHKAERLEAVLAGLKQFTSYMAAYARLPHDEYGRFRRFLAAYPDGVKNASGAFMPTPQLFELLLTKPDFARIAFLTDNERYFSQAANKAFRVAQKQSEAGRNVEDMVASRELLLPPREAALLGNIVEQFVQFKLTHIKVVTTKIPHAFPDKPITDRNALRNFRPFQNASRAGTGKQVGTGGFVPQDYLGDGIRRLLDLQQRLQP